MDLINLKEESKDHENGVLQSSPSDAGPLPRQSAVAGDVVEMSPFPKMRVDANNVVPTAIFNMNQLDSWVGHFHQKRIKKIMSEYETLKSERKSIDDHLGRLENRREKISGRLTETSRKIQKLRIEKKAASRLKNLFRISPNYDAQIRSLVIASDALGRSVERTTALSLVKLYKLESVIQSILDIQDRILEEEQLLVAVLQKMDVVSDLEVALNVFQ